MQQPVAHEKVALIDRPLVFGKGGADDRAVAAEGLEQGLRHRADVALGGGVEGGAVFPEELAAARGAQGFERGEAWLTASSTGTVRIFRATTSASACAAASEASAVSGTPRSWMVRIRCGSGFRQGRCRR